MSWFQIVLVRLASFDELELIRDPHVHCVMSTTESKISISCNIVCSPSNDSDQPVQIRRLIRVITLRSMRSQTSKHSIDGRQVVCLECMDAQADPSIRSADNQSCRKCCVPAHM